MVRWLVAWSGGRLGVVDLVVNDLGRYLRIIYMRLGYCEWFCREWPIVSLVARSLVARSLVARSLVASGPSSDFVKQSGWLVSYLMKNLLLLIRELI